MIQLWQNEAAWRLPFFCEEDAPEGASGKLLEQRQLAVGNNAILATGLGKKGGFTTQTLRRAGAKAVRTALQFGAKAVVLQPGSPAPLGDKGVMALAQGAALALLRPHSYAGNAKVPALNLYIDGDGLPEAETLLAECNQLVWANGFARALTNRPANLCTPECMAADIAAEAKQYGVEAEVLDRAQIEALGMQAFLTVGDSAENPPRLIVLRYAGAPGSSERLALVGKGITCDTGGYCLKPAGSMEGIRGDMAGGAAVCGAILAAAAQKLPVNVVAVVPAAENRISAGSYIPGDVIGSMAGKTIYIGNTDAEGRLILADAVTYAIEKEGATRVVDIATLTGAAYAFFGHVTTPYLTNNDAFAARLEQAADAADEKVWRAPTGGEYREMLKSPYADISNISTGGCGTITGGLFIGDFVGNTPWLHLDIAGTAWVDKPKLEYHAKGATGAMVETLYRLCSLFAEV